MTINRRRETLSWFPAHLQNSPILPVPILSSSVSLSMMTVSKSLRLLTLIGALSTTTAQSDLIEDAIKNLSSESSQKRNEAFQTIWESGTASLDQLKALAGSDDPEIALRSNLLLRRITLRLTPATSPGILTLIDDYPTLNPQNRIVALRKLNTPELSFALLTLWSNETNDHVRSTLQSEASRAFENAILTASQSGNPKDIDTLLRLFPKHPVKPALLASLYTLMGTLSAEVETLEGSVKKEDREILLACYRRSGDLGKALALAKKMGEEKTVVSLSLLAGDGLPYLTWQENLPTNIASQKTTLAIIRAQEEGRTEKADNLAIELLTEAEEATNNSERNFLFRALHLTGYFDLTLPTLEENHPSDLSSIYYSTFQIDKRLANYKSPATEEDQEKWLKERVDKIIESADYQSTPADEIFYLASILETIGEFERCRAIIAPIEAASREKGGEYWKDYLTRMPRSQRNPMLLKTIKDDWKEDDFLSLFDYFSVYQSEDTLPLWNLLAKDEDLSLKERFEEMATFCGWSEPTREARNEAWRRMIKRGSKNEALLDLIIRNGVNIEPVSIVSEAMLARDDRFDHLTKSHQIETVKQFVYLRNWERALGYIQRMDTPEKVAPGLLAGILKKSGQIEKAAKVLKNAIGKQLTNPALLLPMAGNLNLTGCHEDADLIHQRIAYELPPTSTAWTQNLEWMLSTAEKNKDRKMARAVSLAKVALSAKTRSWGKYTDSLSTNLTLNLYRGLDLIDSGNLAKGHDLIHQAAKPLLGSVFVTDTLLLRLEEEDYPEVYDHIFKSSYQHLKKSTDKYPRYRFGRNSIAWLCAVSARHLEEARQHSEASLKDYPNAAYFDTLSRIHRHLGNRDEEIKWQEDVLKNSIYSNFSSRSSMLSRYDWILENPAPEPTE